MAFNLVGAPSGLTSIRCRACNGHFSDRIRIMKLSLRNKFLIPTLVLLILGMAVSSTIGYFYAKKALQDTLTDQIVATVDAVEETLTSWLHDRKVNLETWSTQKVFKAALEDSFVGKAARKSADTIMADLRGKYPYYEDISLADGSGTIVSSSNAKVIGKINVKDRDYFKAAMSGNLFVSDVQRSKGSGNPVFFIAAPVKDTDAVNGVLTGVVSVNAFARMFVDSHKIGDSGYTYIFQSDGTVIAHPDKEKILTLNMAEFDFGKEMIQKGEGVMSYAIEGIEKIVAFQKTKEMNWIIAAVVPTDELLAPARKIGVINLFVGVAVVLLAGVVIFLIARSVATPVNRISKGLAEGASQVAGAATQIASSSQSLAEGASEQAAAIEETSSSMEEMSAMTHQNADNVNQADSLMKAASQVVGKANSSMTELTGSMEGIAKASEETSKIIKTIDEIAFQTNLLALNAAVEAARAGEAGAGFAVVADEVRNLALRAADAAKNTAGLIESTVQKVQEGKTLVTVTGEAFSEVAATSEKVGALINEISLASKEQAQGVEQVNTAVAEMDKVTQSNAANAEESASAAAEMRSQAEQMRKFVEELVALVDGKTVGKKPADPKNRIKTANAEAAAEKLEKRPAAEREKTPSRPEQVIPFEEDFSDF